MRISFAKLIPAKTPEISTQKSIGADFFVPYNSQEFIKLIAEVNKLGMNQLPHGKIEYVDMKQNTYLLYDIGHNCLVIFRPVIIPTGICMDIPENYFLDIRPKSSCLGKGYHVIYGTVDEDYTFGMGIQIEPIPDKQCLIEFGEKFAQFVFHKKELIFNDSVEYSIEDFQKIDSVQKKRGMRVGGFGSTGKF